MNRIERFSADLLTVGEAMTYFKVSRPTLYKAIKSGQIDAVKIGKRWRIRRAKTGAGLQPESNSGKISALQKRPDF